MCLKNFRGITCVIMFFHVIKGILDFFNLFLIKRRKKKALVNLCFRKKSCNLAVFLKKLFAVTDAYVF